jgi:hypothetical protein
LIGRYSFLWPQTQQVPNASHGRVFVLTWIFRKQLVGQQSTIRTLSHDVGESTSSVNPKLPSFLI